MTTRSSETSGNSHDMNDKGNAIQRQAQVLARKVRNETLNLSCPHCQTVYAEFDGCMAVVCASCGRYFCGYCHVATAGDAHPHVLVCSMNPNKTHFGNQEESAKGG